MARTARLKVFRTPIGFHDAYVAAPSQKAAIEAWGSDRDVFRRGEAEEVTDPELMEEPLSRPGEVVRKLRGTAEEQIAALPPNRRKRKPAGREAPTAPARAKRRAKPPPRPSREKLHEAEQALYAVREKQEAEMDKLRRREAELARERAKLEKTQAAEMKRLEARRDKEAKAYERAMEAWRAS